MADSQDSKPPYTIRQLFEISEEQTKSLNKTLGDAFRDEPFTSVVTNGDVEFYGDFHRSTVIAGLLAGEVYVAENASKEIVGVAVWFGPGREMFDRRVKHVPLYRATCQRFAFLPELASLTSQQIPAEVKHASWHLQTIATAPEYQRKGIARAFVDVIKAKAAKAGTPLIVETATEENVEVYEKIGFKRQGEVVTLEGVAGQKFNMWSLSMETAESKVLS